MKKAARRANPAWHPDHGVGVPVLAPEDAATPPTPADADGRLLLASGVVAAVAAPPLVVVDSASSAGCPADGQNVRPWWDCVVAPWADGRTTVVVLDHTPLADATRLLGSVTKAAFADIVSRCGPAAAMQGCSPLWRWNPSSATISAPALTPACWSRGTPAGPSLRRPTGRRSRRCPR